MNKLRSLGLVTLLLATGTVYAQSDDRAEIQGRIMSLRGELKVLEDEFLAPAALDYKNHAAFLEGPGSGLIRLLPREEFDKPEKSTVRGGGAYFSFVLLTHEYGQGSDIELYNGEFSVGFAGGDYGFLGIVTDGDVKSVTLEHPAAQYLASLSIPLKLAGARMEQRRSGQGMIVDGIQYKGRAKALVGGTYVLRSINYDRWDILICFQAVRKDSDGSFILAWKMLRQFDKPVLERIPESY